jgi:hypothetical protein
VKPEDFSPEQAAAVDELRGALDEFAGALNVCRDSGLSLVDAFRAAGIEIPPLIPSGLIENLIPAPA